MTRVFLFISSVIFATTAHGQALFERCESLKNQKTKYVTCMDEQIKRDQRTRDTWIKRVSEKLELRQNQSGNSALLIMFERSIKTFDLYLEDNCRFRFLEKMPNQHQAVIEYKRCELLLIKQHTESLKQYKG